MPFFILLILVLAVGLVCLFSASFAYSYYRNGGDSYYYIKRQLIFAVIGLGAMFAVSFVDYHFLKRFAFAALFVSWGLLVLVLLLPRIQNVHRWIRVAGIQFQPSEIAKFSIILLFSYLIAEHQNSMKRFKKGFLPLIGILGITCGLVFVEPHLSGTILLLAIGLVMMFIGGTRLLHLGGTIGLGCVAALVLVLVMGYEQDRIQVWLDPLGVYTSDMVFASGQSGRDAAWQTVQSLYAIGSGGLMGEGLGNSRQKHSFLPEPQNDFIFAIVCEELGFIGALLIIVLFALLVWRGFYIGMRAPDKFGSLLAIGLTAQVGIQVVFNLAVVTNTFPNTGISLPFFSYGGTSLVMLLMQMGVVLSVSRQTKQRT
ncbi:MAG: cell division protein FtsW [Clostridia bacterium]|nr:cell division protein FtsW [Clostridia bacterium]